MSTFHGIQRSPQPSPDQAAFDRDALLIAAAGSWRGMLADEIRQLRDVVWSMKPACVERFMHEVWLGDGGILARYNATDSRGNRCEAAGLTALVWGCAGRVMITLSRDGEDGQITLIDCDEGGRMGIQSVHGCAVKATRIVYDAIANGQALAESFSSDPNVTMG